MRRVSFCAIFVGILLFGSTAALAQSHDYTFTLSPSQSYLAVELDTNIGSDSDSSSVTGTIGATLTPASGSFGNIHITDINAWLTDNLSLYIAQALAYIDIDLNNFGLLMGQGDGVSPPYGLPGSATTVSGGGFNQTGNLVQGVGQVNYDYDLLIASDSGTVILGNEDPFEADFSGTVSDNGSTTTLTIPLDMEFSGSGITLSITGQLVGTASTVPEPTSIMLLAGGALAVLSQRRKK